MPNKSLSPSPFIPPVFCEMMMARRRPQKMKTIVGILKDKASILKATLVLSSKPASSLRVAVLRATTHHPQEAPPPVDAVLSLAYHHRPSAGILIHALLLRVHGTRNAYVALKCLITLHHVITHGSPALKDLVLSYSTGPLFNVSTFTDDSDDDTLELSNWVRWYADVLDYGLAISRGGGNRAGKLSCFATMVEKISGSPESLHYQKISLIYEVMKLIGEDYRMVMREIKIRVNQFGEKRITNMNDELLDELFDDLKRLQDCKEKLLLMFLNKKNDGVWELIEEARNDVEAVKRKRVQPSPTKLTAVAVVPATRVKRWLDVEWNPMIASFA